MRIQLDWLKEYVEIDRPLEELSEILSMGGLEVEGVETVDLPGSGKSQVLELNVTPNRGYCLSYLGVAREVAAFLGTGFRPPRPEAQLEDAPGTIPVKDRIAVDLQEEALCPRYSAMVIEDVTAGPSPQWLADRLTAMGLRPINAIVDITNYVMMEYGQPLHAFDRELLAGPRIIVRRARNGESFTALNGAELKLEDDALVIADAEKPVALAGIMGGAHSQVTEMTKTVVLESASFDPVAVRQASKKYGLRSDSSYRFERGTDIQGVPAAQARAALLMKELAGGTLCRGQLDIYPHPRPEKTVRIRMDRLNQVLGTRLDSRQVRDYLERLGMVAEQEGPNSSFEIRVPSFRPIVSREIDLIEEVARLTGFDRIPVAPPTGEVVPVRLSRKQETIHQVRDVLSHQGYHEVINYSFIEPENAEEFKAALGPGPAQPIPLSNPLTRDMALMRTSLLPGLLRNTVRNLSVGQKPVKIFEVGAVFFRDPEAPDPRERNFLAVLAAGPHELSVWKDPGQSHDFYDLKGVLESVADRFRVELNYELSRRPFLQPGRAVEVRIGGATAGYLGELSPPVLRKWDLGVKAIALEIDLDVLRQAAPGKIRYQPIPKFPETYRDISLLVDRAVPVQEVIDRIRESGAPLIRRIDLYDQFEGKNIEKGKKSLTFSLTFQSSEKTLTDAEVQPVFEHIVQSLHQKLGATLR